MLDNQTRRELLSKARQSGFPGSILDVFAAYEQGRDLVAEFQQQQEQQQTQQMSEQAAQQSGMQMPQQMQQGQEQPQQGPPPPQGPPPGLPQGSNIPQPPPENTGLVNSNEAQGTGIASNASGRLGGQEILAMGGFREDEYNKFSTHFPFSKEQRGTIAHNATVEHPDLTMVQGKKYVFGGLKYKTGGFKYENDMAKKLQKNTSIGRATSLKANVTRKFEGGGPGDPIKTYPTPEKPVQPVPEYYNANKETFDAADQQARSYMTNWFSQRATGKDESGNLAFPQHAESANAMKEYLEKSGTSAYVPEGTVFNGIKRSNDALGFANSPDYRVTSPLDTSEYSTAMSANPFSFPKSGGDIEGSDAPLTYNTAYYIGEGGKQPTTHLEEQLHLASKYGEYMSPNHAKSFGQVSKGVDIKGLGNTGINQKNIKAMGYPDMDKTNLEYFGDVQEFYPRLMSARRTFGLSPTVKYDKTAMGDFLNKGYDNIAHDMKLLMKDGVMNPEARNNPDLIYKEPGQMEHLIEFYKQLGYPTPSAGFTQGASEEEIIKQKEAAAEKFRMSNEILAMQKKGNATSVEYPPLVSRYGGYRTRR